ncbi:MAG TPA: hypothetical protein VF240_17140 [Pyrinomonadaceae bacterium]
MPWEERSGRRYYYRKVRKGTRVFSVYEGGGLTGALAEARDKDERRERVRSREEVRRELAHADRVEALVERSWLVAETAAKSVLESAGYHLHHRQWRLKRNAEG